MIIARRKRFFRGTLANFCKSKKCIIFNVDYRLGLKKSKFDMTLMGHSPFKLINTNISPFLKTHFIYGFLSLGLLESSLDIKSVSVRE